MKASTSSAQAQYKKMTETPVNKLIATLAVPTVISMLVTMIYNAADTFFVSKINVHASAATGILLSLMAIIQAFGFMYGHGAGSNISRLLGARNIEKARIYSTTAFTLALLTALLIMIGGLIFIAPFMRLLGSTETILPYAEEYGRWILIAAPAMSCSCVMNNLIRYEGMAKLAMIGLATGAVLNMFLDPLFIFTFKMGIRGAGLSTAIAEYISMGILMSVFVRRKTQCRIMPKYLSLRPRMVWEIVSVGAPSFARQGLSSLSTMVLNVHAAPFGDACIAAMSIVSKVMMFILSVSIGIGQGFQPVCAFNYGAKKYERVRSSIRFTWVFSTIVVSALSALVFIFSPQIVRWFRTDAEVVQIGTAALRYVCIAMCLMPTVTCANMTFQSVGLSGKALFISCAQNGLFFIPLIFVLSKLFGVVGIETAQPISFALSAIIALPFLLRFYRSLKEIRN